MFTFIFDETAGEYTLWFDGLEFALGKLREIEPGLWECCPYWLSRFRFGFQYKRIAASTKEEVVKIWLESGENI